MAILSDFDVVTCHTLVGVDSITTLADHGDRCCGISDTKTLADLAFCEGLTIQYQCLEQLALLGFQIELTDALSCFHVCVFLI